MNGSGENSVKNITNRRKTAMKSDFSGYEHSETLNAVKKAEETFFVNKDGLPAAEALKTLKIGMPDVSDAEKRLLRFAPFIKREFPETAEAGGLIESPLTETPALKNALLPDYTGRLFIKRDSELPIAGSVKARGGIYEILKHTETLALKNGILNENDDYSLLSEHKDFFSDYTVQTGSTGNLGLSIGIMSAKIGYRVFVHMSADAKEWKKELLRSKGVNVVEYASDYSEAVRKGRALSEKNAKSYFVDDENSVDLFLGYAVAALRLHKQLEAAEIKIDEKHPLFVYLPCGVGGAPGGITFGLKLVFGDNVRCFFVEPVNAPCMLAAFLCGDCIPVTQIGLNGKTEADGLAVVKASKLVYENMKKLLDGEFTVTDERLNGFLKLIYNTEGLFVEPSAAASLAGFIGMLSAAGKDYVKNCCLPSAFENAVHILWATGGSLVCETERRRLLNG